MTSWRPLPLPNLAPECTGPSVHETLVRQMNQLRQAQGAGPGYQVALSRYVGWVSSAECQFRSLFAGEEAVSALHTPRYWFLVGLDPQAEPRGMLDDEMDLQLATLERYAEQLKHEMEIFQLADGERAVVLDTNFFLHYRQIDQIRWTACLPSRRLLSNRG